MEDKTTSDEVQTLRNVVMDKRKSVEWLDLPKELWIEIAKHLNTTTDLLRFRSVCKTWRFAVPHHTIFAPQVCIPVGKYFLVQTKIYGLKPLSPQSGSISPSKGWVVKFGESKTRPSFHLPLGHPSHLILPSSIWPPRVLNLIDFHVVELIEAYTLNLTLDRDMAKQEFIAVSGIRKVVLVPRSPIKGELIFALYENGKLVVSNIRDDNWKTVHDAYNFDDIILHQGQLYLVDKRGTVFCMDDLSLKFVRYSSISGGRFVQKKHLVVSGGSLHVVDMYIDLNGRRHINIYKERKRERWSQVDNLGDVSFVLGEDSNFSVTAKDYYGFEGNCIYFYDPATRLHFKGAPRLSCFRLEKGMCAQ